MKYIIVTGQPTPNEGFRYIGTFETPTEALEWAELEHLNRDWWISPVIDPGETHGQDSAGTLLGQGHSYVPPMPTKEQWTHVPVDGQDEEYFDEAGYNNAIEEYKKEYGLPGLISSEDFDRMFGQGTDFDG